MCSSLYHSTLNEQKIGIYIKFIWYEKSHLFEHKYSIRHSSESWVRSIHNRGIVFIKRGHKFTINGIILHEFCVCAHADHCCRISGIAAHHKNFFSALNCGQTMGNNQDGGRGRARIVSFFTTFSNLKNVKFLKYYFVEIFQFKNYCEDGADKVNKFSSNNL